MALRCLTKRYKEFETGDYTSINCYPVAGDLFHGRARIDGPPKTPYENGIFWLDMRFPQNYPFKHPKVKFITKIYHCNVNDKGVICLDRLTDNHSPALTIAQVLVAIQSLIDYPNPEDCLQPEIAKLYNSDRSAHDKNAREWTMKYAHAVDTPSIPTIEKIKFEYYHKLQSVQCMINIEHPEIYDGYNKYLKDTQLKIYKDTKSIFEIKGVFNKEEMEYTFTFIQQLEFGSLNRLKAEINFDTPDITKMIGGVSNSVSEHLYVHILSKDEYLMFISGYLRELMNKKKVEIVVPMDVVNLCYEFYYIFFVIYHFEDVYKCVICLNDEDIKRYQEMAGYKLKSELCGILNTDYHKVDIDFIKSKLKTWPMIIESYRHY